MVKAIHLSFLLLLALSACGPGVIDGGSGSTGSDTSSGATSTTTTAGTGTPTTGGTTTAGSTTGVAADADTWANYAQAQFQTNCVSCHTFASTLPGVQSQASQVSSMISDHTMPPAGNTALNANDVTRIVNWINNGSP